MMEDSNSIKLSIRIGTDIHAALGAEAATEGREISEFVQRLLSQHVLAGKWIDPVVAEKLKSRQEIEDGLVKIAIARDREIGVTTDNTDQVFAQGMENPAWLARYSEFVGGNPFASNKTKTELNRLLGMRICRGVGGEVARNEKGKPIKRRATSAIITTFTEMVPRPPKKGGDTK
jgi:hypothetical protein